MSPAYLVVVYLLCAYSWPRMHILELGRWTALCGIGLLAAAVVLGIILPVFELPKPSGPYLIGTVTLHLTDVTRMEVQGSSPGGHRELMIQVWYPAECPGPGQEYRTLAETSFFKQQFALVRTHASRGVPIASTLPRYPVILFSPAWAGRRNQNTVQVEELASHGFVVVGIDHPYGTDLTIFPDGRIARSTLGQGLDFTTDESLEATVRRAEEQLRIRAADARFVLDELDRLNQADPTGLFTSRLDTSRVGIFGHSFGGAVATEVCRTDTRVKAGINLDGLIFGESTTRVIDKPILFLTDDNHILTPAELETIRGPEGRQAAFIARNAEYIHHSLSERGGYWLTLHGTRHMNFCDSPLYSPLKRITRAGPIRPERAMEIINAYMVSFFQKYLEGTDEPLLDAPSPQYPEVKIERVLQDKP
jgi:predicted dienelactone hydrolase